MIRDLRRQEQGLSEAQACSRFDLPSDMEVDVDLRPKAFEQLR